MRSTRSARPTSTSETSDGKEPVGDDARLGVEAGGEGGGIADVPAVVGDEPAVGCGRDVAQLRVAECPERRLEAERGSSSGTGGAGGHDDLVGRDDDDEPRSAAAATIFSRVWAAPPPFTSQPSGVTWSAPSTARSSPSSASNGSTSRPSSRAAARSRATSRRSGWRVLARPVPAGSTRPSCPCRGRRPSRPRPARPRPRPRGAFRRPRPQGYCKRVTWAEWAKPGVVEPSIYAADFARLGEQLESLLDAGARVFHFDIGDGHFIGEITIGPVVLRSIAGLVHEREGSARLPPHGLAARTALRERSRGGRGQRDVPRRGGRRPGRQPRTRVELGLGVGIAFNPETEVERAAAAAAGMDLALCMSIHPGLSGQAFMPEASAASRTCAPWCLTPSSCRWTGAFRPRTRLGSARPARTCSSQAAPSSGRTSPGGLPRPDGDGRRGRRMTSSSRRVRTTT